MRKNSNGVCIESVFNFRGKAINQTRNVMSDARVCAAFVYWEAMQIRTTSCIIWIWLFNVKKVGKVVREEIMFKLVIEFLGKYRNCSEPLSDANPYRVTSIS